MPPGWGSVGAAEAEPTGSKGAAAGGDDKASDDISFPSQGFKTDFYAEYVGCGPRVSTFPQRQISIKRWEKADSLDRFACARKNATVFSPSYASEPPGGQLFSRWHSERGLM